jgi:hypothetical protein
VGAVVVDVLVVEVFAPAAVVVVDVPLLVVAAVLRGAFMRASTRTPMATTTTTIRMALRGCEVLGGRGGPPGSPGSPVGNCVLTYPDGRWLAAPPSGPNAGAPWPA